MVSELFSGFFILVIQSVTFTYFRLGHFSSPPTPHWDPSSPFLPMYLANQTHHNLPPPIPSPLKITPFPFGGEHPLWNWGKLMVFLQLSDCNLRPGMGDAQGVGKENPTFIYIFPFFPVFCSLPFTLINSYFAVSASSWISKINKSSELKNNERDCHCNFICPTIYRRQCPIHNGTF